jgi:hypothetical protein
MLRSVRFSWRVAILLILAPLLWVADPGARAQKPKELEWSHAFDLAVRRFGEAEFTKETQKIGVEVFKDDNNSLAVYVSEKGGLAIAQGFQNLRPPAGGKGPEWLTGLDLPSRRAGQKEFTKETKVHSLEIFRDPNLDNWLFVTEQADLASSSAKSRPAGGARAPKWVHSFDLSCRKGGVKEWKDAVKYGIEVYQDANTGNLIYICGETGAIASIPAAVEVKGEGKAPDWLHGLDLSCRKANEPSFGKETRKFGVEVYRDETTGNLIFIGETGSLAVTAAPANLKAPTPRVSEPRWSHGLNVKCRAYGEKEFSERTRVFGIEVFRDENVGATIYLNELGKLSALATK